jgi:hypothetical protein
MPLFAESADNLTTLVRGQVPAVGVQGPGVLAGLGIIGDLDDDLVAADAEIRGDPGSVVAVKDATVLVADDRDDDAEPIDARAKRGFNIRFKVREQLDPSLFPSGPAERRIRSTQVARHRGLLSRAAPSHVGRGPSLSVGRGSQSQQAGQVR